MNNNWPTKKFGSVCIFVRGPFGGSLKKDCFTKNGYAVYEQQHAINDQFNEIRYFIDEKKFQEMQRFEIKPGDLIMSCSGTMGKTAIVPTNIEKGIINQALLKLTPNNDLDVNFLKYWMESSNFQGSIKKYSKGAAIKNIASVKVLKQIDVPFPPLAEQKRIIKTLDDAFEKLEIARKNTEKNLANTIELFDSYLQDVFDCDDDNWQDIKLGEIIDFFNGYAFKSKNFVKTSNTQVIRMGNLYKNRLNLNRRAVFYPDNIPGSLQKYILTEGDLIISLTGTTDKRDYGYTVQIPRTERSLLLNQRIAKIVILDNEKVTKDFLLYLLLSPPFLDKLYKTANGTRQANLSTSTMKKLLVKFPKTIKYQNQIVTKLNDLLRDTKKLEVVYREKSKQLDGLKKSLLQKAFSGEL